MDSDEDTDWFRINVTFVDKDNEKYEFQVAEGDNLLDIAQANDLEMEGEHDFGFMCLYESGETGY